MGTIDSIAIDGPAGAGKSTIAKGVARVLNMVYVDTGAMYRTVAYKAIKENLDLNKVDDINNLVKNIDIDVKYENFKQVILLDKVDVTDRIRSKEVSKVSSLVAVFSSVRELLVDIQRNISKEYRVVMDGRDIASKVLPEAKLKIYLTASIEERARRRYMEMKKSNVTYEEIKEDIEKRDKNDLERSISPLICVDGAVKIDSTNYSINQVIDKIVDYYNKIR